MNTHCVQYVMCIGWMPYSIHTYVYTYLCVGRNSSTCTQNWTIRLGLLRDPALHDVCVIPCSLVWLPRNNQ